MKILSKTLTIMAVSLGCVVLVTAPSQAAQVKAQTSQTKARPSSTKQPTTPSGQRKLTANDADVAFALTTVESALKQYHALPEAKKRKLEAKIAKIADVKDVSEVSLTLRMFAAAAVAAPLSTKENREMVRVFLNENPKWCGTVKATRLTRSAMAKMGVKGELSLDQVMDLLPE